MVYVSIQCMLSLLNMADYLNFYCAPCLLGKKPASLFSVPLEIFNKSKVGMEYLKNLGLSIHFLYEINEKAHILMFSEKKARKLINMGEIRKAYSFFGYREDFRFEDLMENLFKKFTQFESNGLQQQSVGVFPHEIGLFLGYPPEDVLQYYIKKGKDYLFSGYWKVYTNPEKALETFKLYDECRAYCMKKVRLNFYHLLSA